MAITNSTTFIREALLKKGNPKKFIMVTDSIWDKPLMVIEGQIKKNMLELGIDQVYFATRSTSNSFEFMTGKHVGDSLLAVAEQCLGDGGEDTIIQWSLGINDVGFADKVYNYDLDFAPAEKRIIAAIDYLKALKPNVKIIFVSAPCSYIQSFNEGFERMYKNIASKFDSPFVSGYDALKGVRRATQHTNPNSNFFLDGLHPSEAGLLRFWNYIMMNIVPEFYLKKITPFQYTTPVASPNDQPNFIPINNGWRNDFILTSGIYELKPTNTATHYCFPKLTVLDGQLFSLKLPTGLMGTFVPEVKWIAKNGAVIGNGLMITGAPTKLPALAIGQDRWLISAPHGADRLHVNISDDVNFPAALLADPTICHLKQAYPRTEYAAPIADIMMGFPNLLDY